MNVFERLKGCTISVQEHEVDAEVPGLTVWADNASGCGAEIGIIYERELADLYADAVTAKLTQSLGSITFANMLEAAGKDDVNDAAKHLQTIANIIDGGPAGLCLTDNPDWAALSISERFAEITTWLYYEHTLEQQDAGIS